MVGGNPTLLNVRVIRDGRVDPNNEDIAYTGRFLMFSVITNIYNKKTKGPTIMDFLTATGKLKKFFF